MSSSTYIDSLPYYDKQLDDPSLKAAAQSLIEAELRNTPQINDNDERIPKSIDVFPKSSELSSLLNEYPKKTIKSIDPTKYQPPSISSESTLEELKEAEKLSKISEGHMTLRLENTNLLSNYSPNAWLIRNFQLSSQVKELEESLNQIKEEIININRNRRIYQEDKGKLLNKYENKWQDLISSNVQLEMACKAMNIEVESLKRREEILQKQVNELEV
ncbi:uncharacterized protein I206_107166 [Kwoniella pini CBS 10737]|uniref:Pre-mRNA-splicing factor SPF27 n=1 Tax=Kwoniella pini CBS 10737 TaxID=1296096 RepID=A0A1B9HYZ3_9TREE|nr:uncharacterized protein I206_05288 [Kwoniella pini CBS 10737]OCF48509.1 hypothetical protein I206_05288 [Kwoniella pini CBS 10737]